MMEAIRSSEIRLLLDPRRVMFHHVRESRNFHLRRIALVGNETTWAFGRAGVRMGTVGKYDVFIRK
jgi:hypothetical protein